MFECSIIVETDSFVIALVEKEDHFNESPTSQSSRNMMMITAMMILNMGTVTLMLDMRMRKVMTPGLLVLKLKLRQVIMSLPCLMR